MLTRLHGTPLRPGAALHDTPDLVRILTELSRPHRVRGLPTHPARGGRLARTGGNHARPLLSHGKSSCATHLGRSGRGHPREPRPPRARGNARIRGWRSSRAPVTSPSGTTPCASSTPSRSSCPIRAHRRSTRPGGGNCSTPEPSMTAPHPRRLHACRRARRGGIRRTQRHLIRAQVTDAGHNTHPVPGVGTTPRQSPVCSTVFERFTTYRPGIRHGHVTASHTLDPRRLTRPSTGLSAGRRERGGAGGARTRDQWIMSPRL